MAERESDEEKRKRDDKSDDEREEPKLTPVPARIGEGRDNLRRRREWFERRSGSAD